jgi:hypothetical protein
VRRQAPKPGFNQTNSDFGTNAGFGPTNLGYARGGPVEDAEQDDDTVYPTTAPKWDYLTPEQGLLDASAGYAAGGAVQPSADMNRRAALLAGLRKRYDAMIGMAQGAHAHGDIRTAAHLAGKAHDMVPDGKSLSMQPTPDGNVGATVSSRAGVHSQHVMTPQQFHHYLVGPATSFDHVIDNSVGHNLAIASGQKQPRVPEHPADPIHKVRQVLQHTRKMFGLHRVGQQQAPTGYAGGGPVRGYANGGKVDGGDDWQQYTAEPVDQVITQSPDDNQGVNLHQLPPPSPPEPVTADSSMATLLKRAAEEKWARSKANAPESADVPGAVSGAVSGAWGSTKKSLADYINGANAASPQEVDGTLQGVAEQNPGLTVPETVQRAVAEQNPSLNAPVGAQNAIPDTVAPSGDATVGTGYAAAPTAPVAPVAPARIGLTGPGSETGLLRVTDTKTGKVMETPLGARQREAPARTASEILNNPVLADPVQDLLRRAKETSDPNAQRMFTNEAYKIQETRRVNQQKSADAALNTFSKGKQDLIKSIYTKANSQGEDTLTPDEKALRDEHVRRTLELQRQSGGGGAPAGSQPRVKVGSIAEARKLPSGTLITLPDGSPGQVP